MKNKVLFILISCLLVMSMIFPVSAAGASASVSSSSADRGGTVTLTVSLSGAPNVASGGVSVGYDSSVLELVGGAWNVSGALMSDFGGMGAANEGVFAYVSAADINGTILTLTFKVKDDAAFGSTQVSCALSLNDASDAPISVSCSAGTVSVSCKHPNASAKAEIPSTCTVQGYAAGTYCEACSTYTSGGSRLPLAGHKQTAWEKNNDGTHSRRCQDCTNGNETKPCSYGNWVNNGTDHKKTCTDCGYAVTEAHTMGTWSKADDTNHKRSCDCGAVETAEHSWPTDWSDNGTNHHKVCPTCSGEITENHSFGAWSKADDTNHTRTCATCGKVDTVAHIYTNACDTTCNAEGCGHTRTIEHNYSNRWAKDRTGHWHACTICGDKKDEAEHTPGAAATEYTAQTCTVCNYVIKSALGHKHTMKKNDAVAPTCTEDGKIEHYICMSCGDTFKDAAGFYEIYRASDLIDAAKGHTEIVDAAVVATCTETGLTEGKHCDVCNEVIVAQKTVKATGHTLETLEAVAATCESDGKTAGEQCSVCGEVTVAQKTIPATGHTEIIDAAVAAGCDTEGKTEGKHCEVCGKVIVAQETVPATGAHTFGDWVVATAATETAEGEEKRTCTACGTSETRAIDKLPSAPQGSDPADDSAKNDMLPIIIGVVAGVVVIAVVAVIIIKKKK